MTDRWRPVLWMHCSVSTVFACCHAYTLTVWCFNCMGLIAYLFFLHHLPPIQLCIITIGTLYKSTSLAWFRTKMCTSLPTLFPVLHSTFSSPSLIMFYPMIYSVIFTSLYLSNNLSECSYISILLAVPMFYECSYEKINAIVDLPLIFSCNNLSVCNVLPRLTKCLHVLYSTHQMI